ncbi:acyl-CoA dehydrogenase family protein [Nocardia brasiliensis]|uniref:acyl-CoA dehydrogenase family protein n=1 Tax=Nocardia brasiliensis TaxID=37326 RepID=UPI00366B02D2
MRFLQTERRVVDEVLPGLAKNIDEIPWAEREKAGNPCLGLFRDAGGPGLLIPEQYGGRGVEPVDAVRAHRAVGMLSPSLGIATTMHHFSLVPVLAVAALGDGAELAFISEVARNGLLVASGFAEGRSGQGIMHPTLVAKPCDGGFLVSGQKRPCSLATSMDFLTASAIIPGQDADELAFVLVPAGCPGVLIEKFWRADALGGAESDAVELAEVFIPAELVVRAGTGPDSPLDTVQSVGFLWFELLVSANYLGVASRLAERVLAKTSLSAGLRVEPALALEGAMSGLENVARRIPPVEQSAATTPEVLEELLGQALAARYAAQEVACRVADSCFELLGGIAFATEPEIAQRVIACHALAFHPPSRARNAENLVDYLTGAAPLRLV